MQKPEVAGSPKTLGQHMLQYQPQELGPGQRPCLPVFDLAVLVAECHLAVLAGNNVLLLDHTLVKVAASCSVYDSNWQKVRPIVFQSLLRAGVS